MDEPISPFESVDTSEEINPFAERMLRSVQKYNDKENIPILYLDIDGVLIGADDHDLVPATDVERVLREARELCDVRWLSCWAMAGWLAPETEQELATRLNVPLELVSDIRNPKQFGCTSKDQGIDWEEHEQGRRWAWFDDDLCNSEREIFIEKNALSHYVEVNTFNDLNSLVHAWDALKEKWFGLLQPTQFQTNSGVVVEAMKLTEDALHKLCDWLISHNINPWIGSQRLTITTEQGDIQVNNNDWIIRNMNGEFYSCKSNEFEKTYTRRYSQ